MHLLLRSHSLDETSHLGAALARVLEPGDVVALSGDLGAGKTTLVRAIAAARGVDPAMVASPTFVLVHEYPTRGPGGSASPPLVHVDAYRLRGADDLDSTGWDRLTGREIVLIEWAERIAGALPGPERLARIRIAIAGPTERLFKCEIPDSWATRPAMESLRSLADPDGSESHGPVRPPPGRRDTICRVTGRPVPADSPTWPFADDRARLADLYKWFSGSYQISREVKDSDLETGD